MVKTLREEHVAADADNLNEEETLASFAGLLTVTPANAGTERAAKTAKANTA
jgi:hypothetical protein